MEAKHTATQTVESAIEESCRDFLTLLGENPKRNGLLETPARWAKMMKDLLGGHEFNMKTFPNDGYDEMIIQNNIAFFSLCEHHLVPFFGTATVAYIPGKRLVGISKLARTVELFSRRLQIQERMTQQIAECIGSALKPKGVGVILKARHLCQEMRGIKKIGTETVTSCLRGAFLNNHSARSEFLSFLKT